MTPGKLIQVQSPKVVYTDDSVTVDYEYSTANVQRNDGIVNVSQLKIEMFYFE